MKICKNSAKDYEKFIAKIEKKYGTCLTCGAKMKHQKGIHTFTCICGNRDWYSERFGDKECDG